jgi:hypothetical protein
LDKKKSFRFQTRKQIVCKGNEKLEKSFKKPRWCAAAAVCAKSRKLEKNLKQGGVLQQQIIVRA